MNYQKQNVEQGLMEVAANNRVQHPKYYNSHPSGIECIDVARYYGFNIGNVIKYIWRAGLKTEQGVSNKEKRIEDLEKAKFYLEDEINYLKNAK